MNSTPRTNLGLVISLRKERIFLLTTISYTFMTIFFWHEYYFCRVEFPNYWSSQNLIGCYFTLHCESSGTEKISSIRFHKSLKARDARPCTWHLRETAESERRSALAVVGRCVALSSSPASAPAQIHWTPAWRPAAPAVRLAARWPAFLWAVEACLSVGSKFCTLAEEEEDIEAVGAASPEIGAGSVGADLSLRGDRAKYPVTRLCWHSRDAHAPSSGARGGG